ncbi:Myb DNA-binding domain-containing protein [Artemisia annua]|uniref:Myb DNA-binding domain-containing protein n=1 Tax=Artemisia annua TaxID=35608 RepID=A0A2U1MB99_ARTAN|nr:Myb DNA-binding domain-containing protein [Artemisia annua]
MDQGIWSRKSYPRIRWTPDEDAILLKHIDMHGHRYWKLISKKLPARSADSCRKRWRYQLGPMMARLHKKIKPRPPLPSPPKLIDFLGIGSS